MLLKNRLVESSGSMEQNKNNVTSYRASGEVFRRLSAIARIP
jgi:hypothetical protein